MGHAGLTTVITIGSGDVTLIYLLCSIPLHINDIQIALQ